MEGEVGLRLSAVGWCVHVWRFVGAWRRCATQCVAGRSASAAHSSSSSRFATAVRCHSRISCSMHMDPVGRNAYDSDFVFYAWIDRAGRRIERRRRRAKIRDQLIFCLTTIFNHQSAFDHSSISILISIFIIFHLRMGGRDYCLPRLCVPSLHPSERSV